MLVTVRQEKYIYSSHKKYKVKIKSNKEEIHIDSCPTDALAIAIRYDALIDVLKEVMQKEGFIL